MEYIIARGIWYANELKTIKKKKDVVFQPIFEAFANAWEALIQKYTIEYLCNGRLSINVYLRRTLDIDESPICDFE